MSPIVIGNVRPRVKSIGTLHKGEGKPSDTRPGRNLPYFRFTSDDPEVERAFGEIFGPKPTAIPIRFWHKEKDRNWDVWFQEWKGGILIHQCDGITCNRVLKPDGSYSRDTEPCPYFSGAKPRTSKDPGCQLALSLYMEIPALTALGEDRYIGQVVMRMGGWADYRNIEGTFLWAESTALVDGQIGGYILSRVEYTKRWKDERGSHSSKDWSVDLTPDAAAVMLAGQLFERSLMGDNETEQIVNTDTGEITVPPSKAEVKTDSKPVLTGREWPASEVEKLRALIVRMDADYGVIPSFNSEDEDEEHDAMAEHVMRGILSMSDEDYVGLDVLLNTCAGMPLPEAQRAIGAWFDNAFLDQMLDGYDLEDGLRDKVSYDVIIAKVNKGGPFKLNEMGKRTALLIDTLNTELDLLRGSNIENDRHILTEEEIPF